MLLLLLFHFHFRSQHFLIWNFLIFLWFFWIFSQRIFFFFRDFFLRKYFLMVFTDTHLGIHLRYFTRHHNSRVNMMKNWKQYFFFWFNVAHKQIYYSKQEITMKIFRFCALLWKGNRFFFSSKLKDSCER